MSGKRASVDENSEEDFIIENLIIEGGLVYEDADFMPIRQSLYEIESIAPQYDEEICHFITWCRPNDIYDAPNYFNQKAASARVIQGSLPDDVFTGVLMAVLVYPGSDLIENVFASRPDDFKKHGIFTCRFYVEGEWVEVITDTRLPTVRDQITGQHTPVYSRSANDNEVWISFIEKAYAKAVGNYESIQKAKIGEALLQLTGGSVQQMVVTPEQYEDDVKDLWTTMHAHIHNDTLIVAASNEEESNQTQEVVIEDNADPENQGSGLDQDDMHERGFLPSKLYSVVACKEVGGFELILLHNPWTEKACWHGSWSDSSNDWETYPELLEEIENDPKIQWRRNDPKGYFWMSFKSFSSRFSAIYFCKIFPNKKYSYYCMRGEWVGNEAGGPCVSVRDKEAVVKDANDSKFKAMHKSVAAEVIDGDCSWFNNPQYRIRTTVPTTIYVSIVPLRGADTQKDASSVDATAPIACLTIVSYSKTLANPHLWDVSSCETCNTEFVNGSGRVKGQETSVWKQQLLPAHNYQVVPSTMRRGILGSFILRIFSRQPIIVESVDKVFTSVQSGLWTKDSSGGSLRMLQETKVRENPKWCQNPQFHWSLSNQYGRDELHLKIVVRRTDLPPALKANSSSNDEPSIGVVICKAEYFYDAEEMVIRNKGRVNAKGKPRENVMGELIVSRGSTLRSRGSKGLLDGDDIRISRELPHKTKKILRKTNLLSSGPLADAEYILESTFASKRETCIYYPKLPRAFVPTGLVIIPCLNQTGVRGKFDVEVYCSEKFELSIIPDSLSKVIAGSWTDTVAGGSHLHSSWKNNPKYSLRLKGTPKSSLGEDGQEKYYPVRISLCRHGSAWRNKERKDTVGSMISFYVFISRANDLIELYSAPFAPAAEVCTEDDFKLQPLGKGEEYVIMPTTNSPSVHGNFILSVMCEHEYIFSVTKDKSASSGKGRNAP